MPLIKKHKITTNYENSLDCEFYEKPEVHLIVNKIKPEENIDDNYQPVINSNTVIGNSVDHELTEYLKKKNYLSEFITAGEKAEARKNLGISDKVINDASDVTYSTEGYPFKNVEEALDSLFYVNVNINSFYASPSLEEEGVIIPEVIFKWSINKENITQTLDSNTIDSNVRESKVFNVSQYILKKLSITDGKSSLTKYASVNFNPGRYYGVFSKEPSSLDIINNFKRSLNLSRGNSFEVDASSTDKIYLMVPLFLNNLEFWVGGIEGGFSIANPHFKFERYGKIFDNILYVSDEMGLGKTKITIK